MKNKTTALPGKIPAYALSVFLLTSCGHELIGQGTIALVDPDCNPIVGKRIGINSVESAGYLFKSGHLTQATYITDERGRIDFDIEKDADKMIVFLPDAKGEKKGASTWNWYTTTSSNDEILFLFIASGPAQLTPYKDILLASSRQRPIVITYPYKKDTCNNANPAIDEYNILKRDAEQKARLAAEKAAKKAAEKARIDAIKEVIPVFKTEAYGPVHSFYRDGRILFEIPENTSIITNSHLIRGKDQATGGTFGFLFSMSESPVFKTPSDFHLYLSFPGEGILDPNTGEAMEARLVFERDEGNTGKGLLMHIKDGWKLEPGTWRFQIKYKDAVLLEQCFTIK